MRTYGCCYVDLIFESLKPLDGLVSELPLALGSMGYESSEHDVPNAFMCSTPGNPFWDLCLDAIEDKWHVYPYSWLMPLMEPRKAQKFQACHYLWGTFNAATCKSYFPEAYAVTYWTHTWEHVPQ
ncbi:hypothetical protein WJX84_004738 [Apatococcus fuscideae]|uniref:Uncharacterized protein n=1 Tax=Apatococcus fuscideae TaxID=2026836 RepID=A0AAW1RDX3_9CHLO